MREKAEKQREDSKREYLINREKSRMSRLQSFQKILLINWLIVPFLIVAVWFKLGFWHSVIFLVAWLVIDKLWDEISRILIESAGRASSADPLYIQLEGAVPTWMAAAMIADIVITLLLPLVIAGAAFTFLT